MTEWSTKDLRDAVYGSPVFTRLLDQDALRDTIARGVREGLFGYAVRRGSDIIHIYFEDSIETSEVEFSEDVVLVLPDSARALKDAQPSPEAPVTIDQPTTTEIPPTVPGEQGQIFTGERVAALRWAGEVPPQKWTQLYTKVLSRLVGEGGLKLRVEFESRPPSGLLKERADSVQDGLGELGLPTDVETEEPEQSSDQ
jgi:hypothetical protein